MRPFLLLFAAMALGLNGCANTPEMRTLAGRLGGYADAHRAGLVDAKVRFDALNSDAERERAQLDEQTNEARRRVLERVRAGKIARPTQSVVAEASTPEEIVASLKAVTTTVTPVDGGDAAAKLEAVTKVTAQMAVKPTRLAQLKQAVGIYGEIQGQLETLEAKAVEDAKATKAKATTVGDAKDQTTDDGAPLANN